MLSKIRVSSIFSIQSLPSSPVVTAAPSFAIASSLASLSPPRPLEQRKVAADLSTMQGYWPRSVAITHGTRSPTVAAAEYTSQVKVRQSPPDTTPVADSPPQPLFARRLRLHPQATLIPIRNMWELLICSLRESLVNKSKLFEVSGHYEFKTRWYHSFMFKIEACDSKAGSKMINRGLSASLFLEDLRQNWFKAKDLRQSSQ
nr:protein trichome birefringence-like 4 [Ipomoea batatas]